MAALGVRWWSAARTMNAIYKILLICEGLGGVGVGGWGIGYRTLVQGDPLAHRVVEIEARP